MSTKVSTTRRPPIIVCYQSVGQPQWVITSELNHFEWPGPDLPGGGTEAVSRGFLPKKVTTRLRETIRARVREKKVAAVSRDFDVQQTQANLRKTPPDQDRNR